MRKIHTLSALTTALVLGACSDTSTPEPTAAPASTLSAQRNGVALRSYIVTLRDDVADVPGLAQRLAAQSPLTASAAATATGTVRTWPARWAAPRMAWPSRPRWWRCACWAAPVRAPTPA